MAKQTASGAGIIHFLGGIHEIYFPYILMRPLLLIAAIAGGAAGIFTFLLFGVGLVEAPVTRKYLCYFGINSERKLFRNTRRCVFSNAYVIHHRLDYIKII